VLVRLNALPIGLMLAGTMLASGAAAGPSSAGSAKCPIKASASEARAVQWAFTEFGAPSGSHPGIASSYTHGRGTWAKGKGSGTACHEDSLSGGKPSRDLVLKVTGSARLSPGIVRLGLPGVGLALKVSVAASDDPLCTAGTHGTVTLFASYHEAHRDTVVLRFEGGCSDHDHSYSGATLHVLIARNGKQVNSA
jgi:hypothetical protein